MGWTRQHLQQPISEPCVDARRDARPTGRHRSPTLPEDSPQRTLKGRFAKTAAMLELSSSGHQCPAPAGGASYLWDQVPVKYLISTYKEIKHFCLNATTQRVLHGKPSLASHRMSDTPLPPWGNTSLIQDVTVCSIEGSLYIERTSDCVSM